MGAAAAARRGEARRPAAEEAGRGTGRGEVALVDRWSLQDGLYRDGGLDIAGVVHGVTSRALGNMKDPAARESAARKASAALPLLTVRQVHGTKVVDGDGRPDGFPDLQEGDALVTLLPLNTVAVYVADCMPVFALDKAKQILGLAHAGWKGTRDGVVPALVRNMVERGAKARDLVVAIGPHVGPCCYVVSPDTAAQFPASAVHDSPMGVVVDLAEAAVLQLEQAGVPRASVSVCGVCTASNPDQLFSFRRDKSDQRMMAFAALS